MKIDLGRCVAAIAAAGITACLLLAYAGGHNGSAENAVLTPEKTIADWPETARLAARAMIQEYGEPNLFREDSLIWYGNTPWKRTVVYRSGWLDKSSAQHPEVIEQVITYSVPRDRINDLEHFDGRFTFDSTPRELSFRSNSERSNFLAMNLANEVVSGLKSAEEARAYSTKTIHLAEAGKTSPYTEGFVFQVENDPSPIEEQE